jgi:hypothetical protein
VKDSKKLEASSRRRLMGRVETRRKKMSELRRRAAVGGMAKSLGKKSKAGW